MNVDPMYIPYIEFIYAALLGFAIGFERKKTGKYVGPRTYSLICLGACIFTFIATSDSENPARGFRMAGQIISGIGFLGAGVIWKYGDHIEGITTAASVWVSAAIGLLVGFNFIGLAFFTTILILIILHLKEDKLFPGQNCK